MKNFPSGVNVFRKLPLNEASMTVLNVPCHRLQQVSTQVELVGLYYNNSISRQIFGMNFAV